MSWFTSSLKKIFSHKEIGWKEIGESFTRYTLFRCYWFNIYLHQLFAPNKHPHCHDHPWDFLAIVLWGGYWESINGKTHWRWPGSVLYRPAETKHNVVTKGTNWSLVVTGPKRRPWKIVEEEDDNCRATRPDPS